MKKRIIKSRRKRTTSVRDMLDSTPIKQKQMFNFIKNKLEFVFPNKQQRFTYMKALIHGLETEPYIPPEQRTR